MKVPGGRIGCLALILVFFGYPIMALLKAIFDGTGPNLYPTHKGEIAYLVITLPVIILWIIQKKRGS